MSSKTRGRPKLGPLLKFQRQVIRESNQKKRCGRPSFIPDSLLPKVMDMVAILIMESKEKGKKISVSRAVTRTVDMLVDDMSPESLTLICKAAEVSYLGIGDLAEYRRKQLASQWLITVNVEIKRLYSKKISR